MTKLIRVISKLKSESSFNIREKMISKNLSDIVWYQVVIGLFNNSLKRNQSV
jgi:hypothetical protein